MKTLSFKAKILLLVLVPLVLLSIALTALAIFQVNDLGERNLQVFSEKIYSLRKGELKNYTEMALSSVEHIYASEHRDTEEAQEAAKTILRNLSYGADGYIFVYDYEGTNVVLPTKPHIEGRNLWDVQDKNGVFLIRELVDQAQQGGGYTDYVWDKPSKGHEVDKISYSLGLGDWQWMVGTGLYVDDLEEAVSLIQTEVDDNISKTWQLIAGLALSCTLAVGLIGARFTVSQGRLADKQLQSLSLRVVAGQEEERSRVARQLQQAINQNLVAARARLEQLAQGAKEGESESSADYAFLDKAISNSIQEVYRISGELRPAILDELGLDAAIEALVKQIGEEKNLEIRYRHSGAEQRIRHEIESALYRIVQEALNNILDHADARSVSIRISQRKNGLSLSIQDNGQGFDIRAMEQQGGKAGLGLVDMRMWAESLGGTFTVFSSEGSGTILKVDMPV